MPKTNLPTDSAMRKEMPIATGVLDYFPDALGAVARLSVLGNEKHNPGEPLHWARGKSMDQPDCIMRHTAERDTIDTDDGVLHDIKLAWRALANAQTVIEDRIARGLPIFDEEIIAANRAKQKAAREQKAKEAARAELAERALTETTALPTQKRHPAGYDGRDEGPASATNAIKR
jgi:hypothetical protein